MRRIVLICGHDAADFLADIAAYLRQPAPLVQGRHFEGIQDLPGQIEGDFVLVTSGLRGGSEIGDLVLREATGGVGFYDPFPEETLSRVRRGDTEWISARQFGRYALYLSATGGSVPSIIQRQFGAPRVRVLPPGVNAAEDVYAVGQPTFDLGASGESIHDESCLREIAWRWSGGLFASAVGQPTASYYRSLRFALDRSSGPWRPSAGLLRASLFGVPVVTTDWPGLEEFLRPGSEVLVADSPEEVADLVRNTPEEDRLAIGMRARKRVLAEHTSRHRAEWFAECVERVLASRAVTLR